MRALKWLNKLRKNERGNVLVIGAASMPLLIGATALAVDTIQLTLWKRQLQRAADSGAMAGVYAMAQGASRDSADENSVNEQVNDDLAKNETPTPEDVQINAGSFADGAFSSDDCETRGSTDCNGRAVQVSLESQRWLPFTSFFTRAPSTLRAQAVAALVDDGEYCLISLYDGDEPGIKAGGSGNVTLGCGMATNSTAPSAIYGYGNSTITATPLLAVGGVQPDSRHLLGNPALQPYSPPQEDPLAHIPDPSSSDIAHCDAPPAMGPQSNVTIPSGTRCFTSFEVKGDVTMNDVTLYVTGDVHFTSQAKFNCTNCTIILTGPDGAAGDLTINGDAQINMTAPTSGPHDGVVIYRDRRAPVNGFIWNGGGGLNLMGALYFPTTDVQTSGTFNLNAQCLQLVVRTIEFKGSANIANECPTNGPSAFTRAVPRIVS